jgi:hypothetical protein
MKKGKFRWYHSLFLAVVPLLNMASCAKKMLHPAPATRFKVIDAHLVQGLHPPQQR